MEKKSDGRKGGEGGRRFRGRPREKKSPEGEWGGKKKTCHMYKQKGIREEKRRRGGRKQKHSELDDQRRRKKIGVLKEALGSLK